MPSSLHVSLPDELRAYVEERTNGKSRYSTPSEYVRDLIRRDMEVEHERQYVMAELRKSADEIARRADFRRSAQCRPGRHVR